MKDLHSRLVRLAYQKPELRSILLPLLRKQAGDIGQTILRQMGGQRRIMTMIGAKNFVTGHKDEGALGGISFKFPKPGAGKPNYVKILLMPDDTYTMIFGFMRGYSFKVMKRYDDVHAGQLKRIFERITGLYLSL